MSSSPNSAGAPVLVTVLHHLLQVFLPVCPLAADQAVPIPVLFLQDLLQRKPQLEGLPRLLRPCRLVMDVAVLGDCCHYCQEQQDEREDMCSWERKTHCPLLCATTLPNIVRTISTFATCT